MELVYLLVGLAIGFASAWFIKKSKQGSQSDNEEFIKQRGQIQVLGNEKSALLNAVQMMEADKKELLSQLSMVQKDVLDLSNQLSASRTENKGLEERFTEQKALLSDLQQKFTKDFEIVANKILEEKTQKFTDQNRLSLDVILTPLKDRIKDFEEKVQKVYDVEAAERNMLKGEIKQLMGLNQQMHVEAQNLTRALKGDSKTQGNWGEFILENILEKSGLVKDREYKTQSSVTTDDGKRFQPDVLINLPDGKCLIIDSKVSLVGYEKFVSADDEVAKAIALKEHILSIKNHLKGLSEKSYQNLYGVKSLDFVLLFMPIEPAFALAVQHDSQLFNEAFEKNIVIVSPTTLLATLRTVANIWRQEYQNKNAIEIADQAGKLYDKFDGLIKDLLEVGKKMNDSKTSYEEAMKKLYTGPGNLIKRVEELKKLGAKASKTLPSSLLERAETDS